MGQASVTIDIAAKVTGWKEELNKLKEAASKVDLGSSIGKSLPDTLKKLESRVDSFSRNVQQRLTSGSSVDAFITKINNIDSEFQNIGKTLSNVSFDQLDPSYITSEIADLNKELQQAKIALDEANKANFNQVAPQISSIRIALSRMGEDITKIGMDDAMTKLSQGIVELDSKISDATEKIAEMRSQRDALLQEQKTISTNPLLGITDMSSQVANMIGAQASYGIQQINIEKIRSYIDELKANLSAAGVDIGDETSKINEAFNNLAGSSTAAELRQNLIKLQKTLKEEGKLSNTGLDQIGFGNISSKVKAWVSDNETALTEARNQLQNKITELQVPPEAAATMVDNFVNAVKEGKWEEGKKALEEQLTSYSDTIKTRAVQIEAELTNLKTLIANTDSQNKKDIYTRNIAQEATTKGYDELIAKLTESNSQLAQRVARLEEALKVRQEQALGKVTRAGENVNNRASKAFQENAAAAKMYKTELEQVQAREQLIGKVQGVIKRWFSIYAVVRMVNNAIKSITSTIQELDKTITEIAIVTSMDQSQLWDQIPRYTELAHQYAASISGVYQVSQLYYQQGLQTNDVMALTEQTLKMARISGLDYAEATDFMTNAVRSFKMEMTEAQTVVDVYSAIAASSATDVTELATAMSKTASSAEAVGSSFENTTAMMAVMIEATRESAENIGSAMKSIISRYGEMTSDPSKLVDSEGEEMSLNRVDKALQTVGITLHDTQGQFRNFDEVILDLAEKWETIDSNTQRYIATIMAGNRQQSRFLALVSSYDRLKELSTIASESEDAAQLQFLKTLDSIEAKMQQAKTSMQSLYVNLGIEDVFKGALDILNNIVNTVTNLPTVFNLPIPAIVKIGTTFASIANVVITTFALLRQSFAQKVAQISAETNSTMISGNENATTTRKAQEDSVTNNFQANSARRVQIFNEELASMQASYNSMRYGTPSSALPPSVGGYSNVLPQGYVPINQGPQQNDNNTTIIGKVKGVTRGQAIGGMALTLASLITSTIADNIDEKTQSNRDLKAGLTGISSAAQGAGQGLSIGGLKGAVAGGAFGLIKGLIEAIGIATEDTDEKINNLKSNLEESNNKLLTSKDELKTLTDYKKKYEEVYAARNSSNEEFKTYTDLCNEIAAAYPTLISGMDAEGNYIISLTDNYNALYKAKLQAYNNDFIKNGIDQIKSYSDNDFLLNLLGYDAPAKYTPSGTINPFDYGIFNKEKLLGNLSNYYKNLQVDDWRNDWKTLLLNGMEASGPDRSNGAYLEKLIGFNPYSFGGLGYKMSGNYTGFLQDRGITNSFSNNAEKTSDESSWYKNVIQPIIEYVGEMLDEGMGLNDINTKIKEYFPDFSFSSDLFGAMNELKANIDLRSNYTDKIIKNLNLEATKNALDENELQLDNLEASVINGQVANKWNEFLENNKERTDSDGKKLGLDVLWQEFVLSINDTVQSVADTLDLYSNFTSAEKDRMQDLYTNMGQYSWSQIENNDLYQKLSQEAQDIMKENYDETYSKIIERFNNQMLSWNLDGISLNNKQEGFATLFGPEQFEGIANIYSKIFNNTNLSTQEQAAQAEAITSIYSELVNASLSPEKIQQAISIINTGDLTSITGISAIKNSLHDAGIDINNSLNELADIIHININTEFATFTQGIISNISDFDKALSNASKGMDAENAIKMANQLGVTLKDFDFKSGKYYFQDTDKIIESYLNINESLKTELENYINSIREINSIIEEENLDTGEIFTLPNVFDELYDSENYIDAEDWTNVFNNNKYISQFGFSEEEQKIIRDTYNQFYNGYKEAFDNETFTGTFSNYITQEINSLEENEKALIEEYTQYQVNSLLLTSGQINSFLSSAMGEKFNDMSQEDQAALIKSIQIGNIDNLPEELQQYAQLIYDTYSNIRTEIYEALTGSQGNKGQIQITDTNRAVLEEMKELGLVSFDTNDIMASYVTDAASLQAAQTKILEDTNLTPEERRKYLKQIHDNLYPISPVEVFKQIAGSYDEMDYGEAEDFARALGFETVEDATKHGAIKWDNTKQKYTTTEDIIQAYVDYLDIPADEAAEIIGESAEHTKEQSKQNKFRDIVSNYNKLDEIQAEYIERTFNISKDELLQNADGTYTISMSQIQSIIDSNVNELDGTAIDLIAKIIDDIFGSAKDATTYISNGTTSMVDIESFQKSYSTLMGGKSIDFYYDSILRAWTFDPILLKEYIQKQADQIGLTGEEKEQWVKDQIDSITADNLDFSSYLSGNQTSREEQTLKRNLDTYIKTHLPKEFELWPESDQKEYIESWTQSTLATLSAGGQTAIDKIKSIKGDNVTQSDIEDAYRAQVEPIKQIYDQLEELEKGSIVAKNQIATLRAAGFTVNEDGVIQVVGDLVTAYKSIYDQMVATGEATVSELNAALGSYLDVRSGQGKFQSAIDALSNAADMTYSEFAQLYTDMGQELTEQRVNELIQTGAIKQLGGNRMQITNFDIIATELGYETGGAAYEAGFSAYIDSIISTNEEFNSDSRAAAQLSNLASAKVGTTVNLYDLPEEIKNQFALLGEETYTVTSEAARDTLLLSAISAIDEASLENNPQLKAQIEQLKEDITSKRNIYSGLKGILSKEVSLADAQSFATTHGFDKNMTQKIMEARGYVWDTFTQTFKATSEAVAAAYGDIEMAISDGADIKTINELQQIADDLAYELTYEKKNNAIVDVLQNYSNMSNEAIANLKNAFVNDIDDWEDIITYDPTKGTSKINMKSFLAKINQLKDSTQVIFNDTIQSALTDLTDAYFNDISGGIGLVKDGTTNQAEMLEFTKKLNEATGQNKSVGDYFKYDVNFETFTLSADAMKNYVASQKELFEVLGISGEALDKYIEDQTTKMLANQIDFSSFYSANDRSVTSKTTQQLIKTYRDWYEGKFTTKLTQGTIDNFINTLNEGGEKAVEMMKSIKGNDITSDEIKTAYRAQIDRLQDAATQLEDLTINSIISGNLVNILHSMENELNEEGFKITDLGDGTAVVTAVGNMADAYRLIYWAMKDSAEATTAELNATYARLMSSKDKNEIDAIATLGDAMGMTYDALGELLADYGISLEDAMMHMADYGMQKIGGGKIRIFDFQAFAHSMEWDENSEEYTAAFKTYNDSLIELDNKKKKDILEEINSITEAKGGDKVNLTWLSNYFGEEVVAGLLEKYGGILTNGILTLNNDADIIGIVNELSQLANQKLQLIPEEMAQLQDKIIEMLSAINEMITKGIEGNLSHTEANSLTNWAKQVGVIQDDQELTFIQTQNGLKLSTNQAIKLYNALAKIDDVQAELTFNSLRKNLEETNDNYKSMGTIVNRINELRAIKDTADSTKKEQYEAELEIAEKIARIRATSEDSSMNFMSNDIPAGQNNPLNYYSNWGKAWKTLQDSFKANGADKGKIDYQDFYNIMTEMGNIAEMSGQKIQLSADSFIANAEDAAAAIEKGAGYLSVAADGSIKVDLTKFGLNFSTGADAMAKNVDSGIKAMANSQVQMLDSMISLLEVIVAMEALEDVDSDKDLTIELPEIAIETETDENGIKWITEYTEKYTATREKIITAFTSSDNEQLNTALDNVQINGRTMTSILQASESDLKEWGINAQQMTKIVDGLYKLATSNEYDLDDVWGSFMEIFSGIDFGDAVISVNDGGHEILLKDGDSYQINFDSETVKNNIESAIKNNTTEYKSAYELKKAAQEAYDKYKKGEKLTVTENYTLSIVTGEIQVVTDKDTNKTKYTVGGKDYNSLEDATAAVNLLRTGASADKIEVDPMTSIATSTLKIGKIELTVTSDKEGNINYKTTDGQPFTNREDAIKHMVALYNNKENDSEVTEDQIVEYKQLMNISVTPLVTMSEDSKAKITSEVQQKIREALDSANGEQLQALNEEYNLGLTFNAKVNKLGDLSVEELNSLYETFGIETKTVSLDASITASGDENLIEVTEAAEAIERIINITLSGEDADVLKKIVNATIQVNSTGSEGNINDSGAGNILNSIVTNLSKISANPFTAIITALNNITTDKIVALQTEQNNISSDNISAVRREANSISSTGAKNAKDAINAISSANAVAAKNAINSISPSIKPTNASGTLTVGVSVRQAKAKGNFGALVKGNALASGTKTLMGELGPELVVSNGSYFLAGANGAEFVNLNKDAIVFNHLQTEHLMGQGGIGSRGVPFTNETNAVSYAKGNVEGQALVKATAPITGGTASLGNYYWNGTGRRDQTFKMAEFSLGPTAAKGTGPAMASASAALAALKQLRAQWQSLASIGVKDLAGAGGGGGGGGDKDPSYFIKQLEKWYDWLQQIAELEEEINYQETLRSKIEADLIPHGEDITKSRLTSLAALKEEVKVQKDLQQSQQDYFDERRAWMNSEQNPFSELYTFDENGQLKYRNGKLEELSKMIGTDEYGRPNYTAEEQYNQLVKMGYGKFLQYDGEGNKIDFDKEGADKQSLYTTALESFWNKVDADKEEMQSLHDSINEHRDAVLEKEQAISDLITEIEENQINVEENVLKALEDAREREIDAVKDQKEAIENAANNLIDGLSDQLQKERDMYDKQEDKDELAKLQRQLAILQRSGGSATQIASLQDQINSKMQDNYFEQQQEQIDALQEATDAQVEKLEEQIDLMEEQLAYEKENGLLWAEVYNVMSQSPQAIADFIMANDSSMWGDSPTKTAQDYREMLYEAQQYTEFRDTVEGGINALVEELTDVEVGNPTGAINPHNGIHDVPAYANGGLVDATGLIQIDGTKKKPEGILSGDDTAAMQQFWARLNTDKDEMQELRDYIHSQSVNQQAQALANAMKSAQTSLPDIEEIRASVENSNSNSGETIIIQRQELSMNVEHINNDYEAERAGEKALEKMISIARKSNGLNRVSGR